MAIVKRGKVRVTLIERTFTNDIHYNALFKKYIKRFNIVGMFTIIGSYRRHNSVQDDVMFSDLVQY